ncbi:hypothetical protein CsatB_028210 [Cannabis sativa]
MANTTTESSLFQQLSNKLSSSKMEELSDRHGVKNELSELHNDFQAKTRDVVSEDDRLSSKKAAYDNEDLLDRFFSNNR